MNVIEINSGYSIVWQIFEEDSDLVREYKLPGAVSLPYFVGGEAVAVKLQKRERISLTLGENDLLIGLLLRCNSTPPLTVTHEIRPYSRDILIDLLERFREYREYDSIEQCIMVICAYLKEENGELVSRRALKTGLEIIPGSSRIKNVLSQMEI